MGGTNEPDNLIELTVSQHARAHYVLWNIYGKPQDKLAWKGLSGMIGKEEILLEKCRLGGTISKGATGYIHTECSRQKMSAAKRGRSLSLETKRKMSLAHSGPNNHFYGKTHSLQTRVRLSSFHKNRTRGLNYNSKTYLLTSPSGEEYYVTGALKKFCEERKLTYKTMSSAAQNGVVAPRRNGWSIKLLNCLVSQ